MELMKLSNVKTAFCFPCFQSAEKTWHLCLSSTSCSEEGNKKKTFELSTSLHELNIQVLSWKRVDQTKCAGVQKFMLITFWDISVLITELSHSWNRQAMILFYLFIDSFHSVCFNKDAHKTPCAAHYHCREEASDWLWFSVTCTNSSSRPLWGEADKLWPRKSTGE